MVSPALFERSFHASDSETTHPERERYLLFLFAMLGAFTFR